MASIAAIIMMGQASVLTLFDAFLVAGSLIQDLKTTRGITATSDRLREGYVYDTTYWNDYVCVKTEGRLKKL